MSSTLRSSKFVRYFTGIARNVVSNTKIGEADGRFVQQSACLNYILSKTFATRSTAISSHSSNGNLDRNLRRLDQYARRVGRISKNDVDDILQELRHSKSATSTQSLLIIRCCGNLIPEESPAMRTQLAEEIWRTLDKIEHKGIEPNRVTFQHLITRYCQEGDIDGATQILDDMESAAGIFGVMEQAGLEPTSSTYTALLCGYAKKGDFDAMEAAMQECVKKEIQLLDKDYMEIIYTLAMNNHIEHVDKIIEKMRKTAGFNQEAVNLILRLVNCGHVDTAYKVLLTMPQSIREGEENSSGSFFIRQLVKSNYPLEKLKSICEKLEKEAVHPQALSVATECSLLSETLRDFVLPSLEKKSSEEIVNILKTSGVTIAAAASALVMHNLCKNAIGEAARVASRYRAYYPAALLRRPLIDAYVHTDDKDSFITVLRQIHDSVGRVVPSDEEISPGVMDRAEVVGRIVCELAAVSLLDQGLGLSNSAAERLQDKLGEEMTNEISSLLDKLTSGDLVPSTIRQPGARSSAGMERRDENAQSTKRQQFNAFCRNKDLEKVEQLLKEFERENFVLTGGMYAQLLELYYHHEKLEDVMRILETLKEKIPDFNLDQTKIIKAAILLVKNDKFSGTLEEKSFQYRSSCWQLLNSLAESGKVDELKQMFNTLVEHNYIDVSNVLLGPLIKVHVLRNDLPQAMEQFEWCCQKYRATPWKSELACKMIQAEDAASLQKLTDLSTQVHGEVNSLYDLVFAFIECGRIRQARKILETPGLRSRPHRLNSACERYQQGGLWTRMQEEDVQPSDEFLTTLGNLLKAEGREVPFVLPEVIRAPKLGRKGKSIQKNDSVSSKLKQALREECPHNLYTVYNNYYDL
ncbi:hypothetical protein C0J52_21546 [Blattella germanica]|nr:hypothetical protein C0J52_21546 [Blattella germanica]